MPRPKKPSRAGISSLVADSEVREEKGLKETETCGSLGREKMGLLLKCVGREGHKLEHIAMAIEALVPVFGGEFRIAVDNNNET